MLLLTMKPRIHRERDVAIMLHLATGTPMAQVARHYGLSYARVKYIKERFISEQNQQP